MKKISLIEFQKLCEDMDFKTFIYTSENQNCLQHDSSMKIEMVFTKIKILFNPNIIYLTDVYKNSLRFHRVSYINIHKKQSALGIIFSIICEDMHDKSKNFEYICIAR